MRAYNVRIVAETPTGTTVRFVEVIAFPTHATTVDGAVREPVREAGAIEQVRIKNPLLRNIRAEGSIHVSRSDRQEITDAYVRVMI